MKFNTFKFGFESNGQKCSIQISHNVEAHPQK